MLDQKLNIQVRTDKFNWHQSPIAKPYAPIHVQGSVSREGSNVNKKKKITSTAQWSFIILCSMLINFDKATNEI